MAQRKEKDTSCREITPLHFLSVTALQELFHKLGYGSPRNIHMAENSTIPDWISELWDNAPSFCRYCGSHALQQNTKHSHTNRTCHARGARWSLHDLRAKSTPRGYTDSTQGRYWYIERMRERTGNLYFSVSPPSLPPFKNVIQRQGIKQSPASTYSRYK